MSHRTPGARSASVKEVRDALLASRRSVLTTHLNADGDGAGCEAALAAWLRANGTVVHVINPTPFPDNFRFLFEDDSCIVDASGPRAQALCDQADVAVVLDTGEVPRIGRVRGMIRELPTVVIDHHQPSAKPIGGTSLRDPGACATGELLFEVIQAAGGPWPQAVVDGLYVAILTDTGSFRFANATPQAHRVTAELIARGADPEELHKQVYGAAPLRKYRILEKALATLEVDEAHGIAWMVVPSAAIAELGATQEDLEGMVDIPRGIEDVGVGLLFRASSTGEIKVSFRSNGPVDVNELARRFGGGGHIKASGAMVPGPIESAIDVVVEATREAVSRHSEE